MRQFTGQVAVLTGSWVNQVFKIGHMQDSGLCHFSSYSPQNSVPLMQHHAADNFYFIPLLLSFLFLCHQYVQSACTTDAFGDLWCSFFFPLQFSQMNSWVSKPNVQQDCQMSPFLYTRIYQKRFSPVLCASYESEFDVMHWFYWA